jgi:predicted DNA binding CopG/RHH family protein
MKKNKSRRESIPKEFATLEAAAEFWDKHDLTDYWKDMKEVKVDVKVPSTPRYIPLEKEIAKFITKIARNQHVTPETLVNLWLKERLIMAAKNKSSISVV